MSLLNEIQQKLKVPKSQYNSFAKYHYRNAEDILEAVKPLLGKGTLIVEDEVVQVGDRYYVKSTAHLWNGESESEKRVWASVGWAREELDKKGMDAAQITGAASSYARKYALNGLFCIDDTKDADNTSFSVSQAPSLREQGWEKVGPAAIQAPEAPKQPGATPKSAPTAPKLTQRQEAAKDRIRQCLGLLGEPNDTVPQVAEAVKRLTGLELQIANFEVIGEKLGKLVEDSVDPTK